MGEMNAADDKVKRSVVIGIGVPLGILLLAPFAWWIYRGFKPKRSTITEERSAAGDGTERDR
jgi:flagellar basal body-associated protein FliL